MKRQAVGCQDISPNNEGLTLSLFPPGAILTV
jgi:hypothetical protein